MEYAPEFSYSRHYRIPNIARWSPGMRGSGSSEGGGLSDFIDGLGPGQLVGRQLLGATTLGDVQLSMCYQKGFLEVKKYKYIFFKSNFFLLFLFRGGAHGFTQIQSIFSGGSHTCSRLTSQARKPNPSSAIRQGLSRERKAMYSQSKDNNRTTYARPSLPANANVSRKLQRMCTAGD